MKKVEACILGGSGYGGGELIRLLSQHPHVGTIHAISRTHAGEPFCNVHPNLRSLIDGAFEAVPNWTALAQAANSVLFSALPHFELARQLPTLEKAWARLDLEQRLTLIDLSGDFRLSEAPAFERAYGRPHPYPQALGTFVYGLPEWRKAALHGAKRIANPGCFATAIQLGLLPLAGLKDLGFIAINAVTGSSGSGASPGETTHHPTRAHDFLAYKVYTHQHEAEVTQLLDTEGTVNYNIGFVPHSAPLVRGIFATMQLYRPSVPRLSQSALQAHYTNFYRNHPYVRIVEGTPRVIAVAGSNFCDIAVHETNGNVAIMAALDNLVKGMAGQALQNMNLALEFDESEGLRFAGSYPA